MVLPTNDQTVGVLTFFIFILVIIFIALLTYVYQAVSLYYIAKKTKTQNEWLAWIPVGNLVLMANIANMHWWPILLYIPVIFFIFLSMLFSILGRSILSSIMLLLSYAFMTVIGVYIIIWLWKIYEKVSRPGFWSIVPVIISVVGFFSIFIGIIWKNPIYLWIGISIILGGIVQGYAYMGIAAWHKDSVVKKRR